MEPDKVSELSKSTGSSCKLRLHVQMVVLVKFPIVAHSTKTSTTRTAGDFYLRNYKSI